MERQIGAYGLSSVSQAGSPERIGEFWDMHDFTEFDGPDVPDAEFEVSCGVPVEVDLLMQVEKQARLRGVSVETLVNLWLQEKLAEKA
jgi:hypothetical protein